MTVIVHQLTDDNTFEEIGRVDGDSITEGEDALTRIDRRDVWIGRSEAELADRFNGPRVMATIEEGGESDATTQAAHTTTTVTVAATPEGVPDGYEYLPPDEEPPDDRDTVESPRGATYVAPADGGVADDDGVRTDPNPEEDIDRFQNSEAAAEAIEQTNEQPMEGFTFHRNLEHQPLGERDEWAVGLGVGGDQFDRDLTKDDVIDVYESQQDLLADTPGLRIGGYHFEEGGKFEIELSVTVTDREEAEALGESLNQESVFNLGTEELIFTDGSGDSPLDDADDVRAIVDELESITEMALPTGTLTAPMTTHANEQDTTSVYVSDDGEELSFAQIAMAAAKDPQVTVEDTDEGYLVDGELFTPAVGDE